MSLENKLLAELVLRSKRRGTVSRATSSKCSAIEAAVGALYVNPALRETPKPVKFSYTPRRSGWPAYQRRDCRLLHSPHSSLSDANEDVENEELLTDEPTDLKEVKGLRDAGQKLS